MRIITPCCPARFTAILAGFIVSFEQINDDDDDAEPYVLVIELTVQVSYS